LDARFVYDAAAQSHRLSKSDSALGMQGVLFQCPACGIGKPHGCDDERSYIEGDHYILVFFANPFGAAPAPAGCVPSPRWTIVAGTTLDDLTLSPSVDCTKGGGCSFHGWVRNGDAA
jgi:hypothetical protein